MSVLHTEQEDGVLRVTLNRPGSMNAFDDELTAACIETVESVEERDVGCVVLSGAGSAFSAGGDIDRMESRLEADVDPVAFKQSTERGTHTLVSRLYHLSVPTIAKVDGPAVGMGFSVALTCDNIFASEEATFGATFRNAGLGPDSGLSHLLPRHCGPKIALELLYSGDQIEAQRAAAVGIVNRVIPGARLDAEVADIAADYAAAPRAALAASKQLVRQERGYEATLDAEATMQALMYSTDDHRDAVRAFQETPSE